ncbi:MAG: MoxR family ATPase [Deltaproteobacteria bacterium]|nr:MAG: MoxR family ATPase [Deltaproteobacteria bacterium]
MGAHQAIQTAGDAQLAEQMATAQQQVLAQIGRRVVGQQAIVEQLLVMLFAGGHGLFVGVPGLAKTLLIQTLGEVLDLPFNRIQFTPDLMPSDITGTDVLEQDAEGRRGFRFVRGPVFCNLLLADEINRTPPKTQAALLQAMQEGRITAGGKTFELGRPFHVFATQNPLEQQGTYPLPEAQLDRFMMMLRVDYPTLDEEMQIVRSTTAAAAEAPRKVLSAATILAFQGLVPRVPISDEVVSRAVGLVRATRPHSGAASRQVQEFVAFGAGPRAAQHLVLAAKARALLAGRAAVDRADVDALAPPVLRHRVLLNFAAEAQRVSSDDIVAAVCDAQR